ncbi:MAG: hypothetical protein NZ920_00650 [Aigarchaeota archaeon]|nr:hypothetical protein [Aigarchaeota archaeon]MDW8092951.1 hypothetical protein [Nitrososphaerota archaeon]
MKLKLLSEGMKIGVIIDDSFLASQVMEAAGRHGFNVHWVNDEGELPVWVRVIIVRGKRPESWRRVFDIEAYDSVECLLAHVLLSSLRLASISRLGVAIDLGLENGVAVGVDGRVIATGTFRDLDDGIQEAVWLGECIGQRRFTFYLGGLEGIEDAIDAIKRRAPNSSIIIVRDSEDETLTTSAVYGHEFSAIGIYYRGESMLTNP